ncbi:MAG TPA: MFS transporter [Actinomycetota bacterium]|nr:MFS transporter [Actinomycetota bacterium]
MAPASSVRSVAADPAVRVGVGVTLVIMLGYGLIVPVLPLYARSFGVGKAEVGLLLSSFALMRLVFDLVAGPLVDRAGPRAVATGGAVVVALSGALSALAPSFGFLLAARAVGGAGSSLLFAAVMSHLLQAVPPGRMARTMSLYYASFLLGMVLGQPVGGLIASIAGLAAPLWFYAGACLVSAGVTMRFLADRGPRGVAEAETPQEVLAGAEGGAPTAWGRLRGLLRGRAFVAALVANAILFWVLGSVRLTLVPLFAGERLGLGAAQIGALLGVAAVAQFLLMWKAGSLADARGRRLVLLPSLIVVAIGTALLGWTASALTLGAVLAVLGAATGFSGVVPAAVVADVAPKRSSGTAVGAYRFAGDLGFVLGPFVAGGVAEAYGFRAAFVVIAVPVLVAVALVGRMPETLSTQAANSSLGAGRPRK